MNYPLYQQSSKILDQLATASRSLDEIKGSKISDSSSLLTSFDFYSNLNRFEKDFQKRKEYIQLRGIRGSLKNDDSVGLPVKGVDSNVKEARKKLPKIGKRLVDLAVEWGVIGNKEINKLIVDPNRYSVFFEEIDLQCPYTIKAIENLEIPFEKLKLLNFEYFQIEGTTKIQQLLSYLIHISQQYELFKRVIKERNHLKSIDREIGRKFKNIAFPTEISSSNEIMENPINRDTSPTKSNRNLQLYLNHARTYTNEERKNIIMKKLEQKKLNAENYIRNLTMKKFDAEIYQQEIKQKISEVEKKKREFVKEKASKAKKNIEYAEHIIEKNKEKEKDKECSFPEIQNAYKERMKELEGRIDKEKNKIVDKIKDFNQKNEKYAQMAQEHIRKLKEEEEQDILKTITEIEKKDMNVAHKNLEKMKKYAKNGEDQTKHLQEQLFKKQIIDELDSKNKINNFLNNFQSQYDSTRNKRKKILEEKSNSIKKSLEENMKAFFENKERNLEKTEEWRNELKNRLDVKMNGVKNVENLKKNKQEFLNHILFEKKQKILELKEEEENKLANKRKTLILKSIHSKNKIGMRRSEEKFVVEERKDYNLRLNKYKNNLLNKVTV